MVAIVFHSLLLFGRPGAQVERMEDNGDHRFLVLDRQYLQLFVGHAPCPDREGHWRRLPVATVQRSIDHDRNG